MILIDHLIKNLNLIWVKKDKVDSKKEKNEDNNDRNNNPKKSFICK